ncbi:alpha/beta fold hydrolase [Methylobacterium dankookense]|uniref:Haloalkane dehalogenase 2 n=1 Tax=Methylobacterium dankookense TaxID=560405 RepID=A0A564G8C0_9HYPH|nr:alpha/beta hydrolase [Methylobacterium dankookense]GJD57641.1 Haloalkane dehalogenase 2 [Methylobacterium dankookense]VUF15781.1 Haloalkane dehalogenase 2 [Methylobacterium dankookense]
MAQRPLYSRPVALAGLSAAALAFAAFAVRARARQAEQDNPPTGRLINVDGIQVHYAEVGQGEPLVLLHGNGSMLQDFMSSDFVKAAAKRYRVIAFDRPGYGYSERPRSTIWTPPAQARLLRSALLQIGVSRALVLGHSWGASVAITLALDHPQLVRGLILESGYYYGSVRADVVLMSGPALPLVGDIMRYTVSPLVARLLWPAMIRKLFSPAPVAATFGDVPSEMAIRPSQLRASAAESALMIPDALAMQSRYQELSMPVAIVAGTGDKMVDLDNQALRLHRALSGSSLHVVEGCGHMVHHTAPNVVMAAVDTAAQAP